MVNDRFGGDGSSGMWHKLRQILEMIRFSHTVFALPFALMAADMAWNVPTTAGEQITFRIRHLLAILICMVTARSAAMAFNRLADREIDARNPRTAERHLPSGRLRVQVVVVFLVVMSIGFVAGTTLFLPNWLPLVLALPVLAFLFTYSYTKRLTSMSHFWLGAALMLAPVSVWIALRGEVVMRDPLDLMPAAVLGAAVLLWVAGFDMIYATQDVDYDVKSQLQSVPAKIGVMGALRLAAVCHLVMIALLFFLPFVDRMGGPPLPLGILYFASIAVIGLLLLYEHAIVSPDDLTRVNVAFFHVNAVISLGLFAVVAVDLWL
jgi:4-hydroxybenzoate polyprenyltransferase